MFYNLYLDITCVMLELFFSSCEKAGVPLRLFHKEVEGYMVCEGLFEDEVTEEGRNITNIILGIDLLLGNTNFKYILWYLKVYRTEK